MSNINDGYEVVATLDEDCSALQLTHFRMLRRALKKFVGKELILTINILKYKRSDAQNRYMWGVVVKYVKHWLKETKGETYTSNQVYTWLRIVLLAEEPVVTIIAGREIIEMTGKRFSAMSTAEFAIAVDTIREKMLAKGLDIPEPQKGKKHNMIHEFLIDE